MAETRTMSRRTLLKGASVVPLAAGTALVSAEAGAQSEESRRRVLVAFFSRSGNTALVARKIAMAREGGLFEIRPAEAYPENYEQTVAQAEREREAGYEPPLAGTVPDIADYATVFLGFPIWGMTAPPVIRSFLSRHDLSGRTIVPFITHGGYGVGSSLDVVASHAPDARLVDGFSMEGEQERRVVDRVEDWLGDLQPSE
jgi:flavodoxin